MLRFWPSLFFPRFFAFSNLLRRVFRLNFNLVIFVSYVELLYRLAGDLALKTKYYSTLFSISFFPFPFSIKTLFSISFFPFPFSISFFFKNARSIFVLFLLGGCVGYFTYWSREHPARNCREPP